MRHQAKERWELDGSKSRLGFSLRHIVVSEIQGRFGKWDAEMFFDPDDLTRTRIRVWIDVESVDTDSAERDAHLRSAEFFDAEQFPRAEFTSTEAVRRKDGEATVKGELTLHGTTCDVELVVTAERNWLDADGLLRAAYRVRGQIDRQAFGLHWNQDLDVGGIVVGDTVQIQAHVEMVHAAPATFARLEPEREIPAP
jgi:polyisoprenoid-binding protein YceI